MGETKRRSIVDNEREFLKSKTAYVLPDNPSSKGWSASQSKAKMYEGILLLYDWFKDYESITSDNFNLIETNIGKIVDGHTIVGKAKCDEDGNDISTYYLSNASHNSYVSTINVQLLALTNKDTYLEGLIEEQNSNLEEATTRITALEGNTISINAQIENIESDIEDTNESVLALSQVAQGKSRTYVVANALALGIEDETSNKVDLLLTDTFTNVTDNKTYAFSELNTGDYILTTEDGTSDYFIVKSDTKVTLYGIYPDRAILSDYATKAYVDSELSDGITEITQALSDIADAWEGI